jgi:hypothetical protein
MPLRRPDWPLLLRRGHLYTGLFMLPWAVLYAVTAFLFNHPAAFADQPTATFDRSALAGTPLETPPDPAAIARQVVAALRARQPDARYELADLADARFTREFAFATVAAADREVSVLVNIDGTGGTVRSRPLPPPAPAVRAPFAVGGGPGKPAERLALDDPLPERVAAAVPAVLGRTGFPAGAVTVTSVPDVAFRMRDGAAVWAVTYSPTAGTVAGRPADREAPAEASVRRSLLRLHTAHGYPGGFGPRWAWAAAVDATAAAMLFWAASGAVMWWRMRAVRAAGAVVLLAGAAAAGWAGLAVHAAGPGR